MQSPKADKNPNDNVVEFDILYYKRKNKVHKSKGVSKMDGRLRIHRDTNVIKLFEDDSKKIIHQSINAEVASKTMQLQTDTDISLGHYEIEIVNVSENSASERIPALPKRKIIKSGVSVGTQNRKAFAVLNRKKSTSSKTSLTFSRKATDFKKSWLQSRKPPAQPKTDGVKHLALSSESESEEELPTRKTVGMKQLTEKGNSLLGRKRKLVTAARSKSPISNNTVVHASLPGAIGNLILPPSILSVLRPHQQSGVVFLWNCLTGVSPKLREVASHLGSVPKGAILADSMGMGKTLMTISTIIALYRRNKQHRFIVVCPSSLVENWAKEFDKWLGRASQPKRSVVRKGGQIGLQTIRSFVPVKPNHSEILIISYELFRMNSNLLKEAKQVGLLVVDEGHRLKNSAGSITFSALCALSCDARLLITGTPIQNDLSEFHTVANFVCPGILGNLPEFRRDFARPITTASCKNATREQRIIAQEQSRKLDKMTKTFLLRRLAKDVLTNLLPPRTEMLLFCRPSPLQRKLYDEVTANHISDPLSTLTKLRKLCSHPTLLGKENADVISSSCESSGKLEILGKLLDEVKTTHPDEKVVLVSCFTSTLSLIETLLVKPKGWTYKRLDGATPQIERQPMVDSFNRVSAEKAFLFLLSSKAGGVGLNLVGANRLIMFDADYNPAVDAQAMARIYRPGQTKPCFIYRFFTVGTVEEVVYQRQQQKDSLANMTVDRDSGNESGRFSEEELRDCFTLKDNNLCVCKDKLAWPDYNKVSDGLIKEGCSDDPLLRVAETTSNVLTYVRVAPQAQNRPDSEASLLEHDDQSEDEESIHSSESEDDNEASSQEEYEFED